MRSLFKILISTVATGVFLWVAGSLYAMPITGPDADVTLDIGGWATAATGWYTPTETAAGDQPPSYLSMSSEQRLNLTYGTESFTAWAQLWRRFDNAGVGGVDQQHIQLFWRPIESLEITLGRLAYLHWTDRAVQWETYIGWTPAIAGTGNPYFGYIETTDGVDVTYDLGSDMRVGLAYITEGKVSGVTIDTDLVASTIIPHFTMTGAFQLRVSYYLETVETTGDDWANSDSASSTLLVVDFKLNYDDAGSQIKVDFLNRIVAAESDGSDEDGTDTGISVGWTQMLGDAGNSVFVELNTNTLADDDAVDDKVTLWLRVGYAFPIAEGSRGTIEFFQLSDDQGDIDGDTVAQNWIGLGLLQSF